MTTFYASSRARVPQYSAGAALRQVLVGEFIKVVGTIALFWRRGTRAALGMAGAAVRLCGGARCVLAAVDEGTGESRGCRTD